MTLTHWWTQASYGHNGAWAHVQKSDEDVAPWMLLMVIVFGFIYAVDAVVASVAVLTTLRESPLVREEPETILTVPAVPVASTPLFANNAASSVAMPSMRNLHANRTPLRPI